MKISSLFFIKRDNIFTHVVLIYLPLLYFFYNTAGIESLLKNNLEDSIVYLRGDLNFNYEKKYGRGTRKVEFELNGEKYFFLCARDSDALCKSIEYNYYQNRREKIDNCLLKVIKISRLKSGGVHLFPLALTCGDRFYSRGRSEKYSFYYNKATHIFSSLLHCIFLIYSFILVFSFVFNYIVGGKHENA